MYFGPDTGTVFRPPSEANSFLLRLTIGCSHNKCAFCSMYKAVQFRTLDDNMVERQIQAAEKYSHTIRRIFLCDGDAMVLETARLLRVLEQLRATFPKLQRVACYASPLNLASKNAAELSQLRAAGLQLVYFGIESGSDELLAKINKGVDSRQMFDAAQKIHAAGIKLSCTIINGLAGNGRWRQHAEDTARLIAAMQPDMLSALTMMLNQGSQYYEDYMRGAFIPLRPAQLALEMKLFFETLANQKWQGGNCIFRSNHISNSFNLAGILPRDIATLTDSCAKYAEMLKHTSWSVLNDVDG